MGMKEKVIRELAQYLASCSTGLSRCFVDFIRHNDWPNYERDLQAGSVANVANLVTLVQTQPRSYEPIRPIKQRQKPTS